MSVTVNAREAFAEADALLRKSLIHFIDSFKTQLRTCISCNNELETKSSLIAESPLGRSIVSEICIKSLLHGNNVKYYDVGNLNLNDLSVPFCKECTGSVSTLTDLYRQFKAIEEEFNKVRSQFARGIFKTYAQSHPESCDEINIFHSWQVSVGLRSRKKSDRDANLQSSTQPTNVDVRIDHIEDIDVTPIKAEPLEDNDIQSEDNGDSFPTEEAEEFMIIPDELNGSDHSRLSPLNENLYPTIQIDGITEGENEIKNRVSESQDSDSDSQQSQQHYDEYAEDEYVPPSHSNTPKSGTRILTRRRAKSLAIPNSASLGSSNNESDTDHDHSSSNISTDSGSESDELEPVRPKRKYVKTKRSSTPKKKAKPSAPKNKQVKSKFEADGSPKVKPKRIRKPEPPVTCPVCNKTISRSTGLTIHMRIHTGEKPCKCSVPDCGMSFYKTSNLTAHMITHAEEKPRPYACDICNTKFTNKPSLRAHQAALHDVIVDGQYPCKFCTRSFISKGAITDHYNRKHAVDANGVASNIRCFYCEMDVETIEAMAEHSATEEHSRIKELKIKPIKTPRTRKRLEDSPNTTTTKRVRKPKKKKSKADRDAEGPKEPRPPNMVYPRLCPECGITIPDRSAFIKHQKRVHPTRNFQCDICGKHFSENGNLKKHIEAHNDVKRFVCQFCGEKFKHKLSLNFHLTKHTGEGSLFQCEYCPKPQGSFNNPRCYRRHLVLSHPDSHLKEKPFFCKCCYKNFESESTLSDHLESAHSQLKCKFCKLFFGTNSNLRTHLRIHTGERPYKCSVCDKTFTQETNLKEHEYRHSGSRPHRCSVCGDGFLRRKELQKHANTFHTEEEIKNSTSQELTGAFNKTEPASKNESTSSIEQHITIDDSFFGF